MVGVHSSVGLFDKLLRCAKRPNTCSSVHCFAEVVVNRGTSGRIDSFELTRAGDIYPLNHIVDDRQRKDCQQNDRCLHTDHRERHQSSEYLNEDYSDTED